MVFFVSTLLCFALQIKAQQNNDSIFKVYRKEYNECEDLLRKGKIEKAITCYESSTLNFPTQIRSYVRLAEIYYLHKNLSKALFYANKAIDLNPNEAYAPMTYLANKMNSNKDEEIAIKI